MPKAKARKADGYNLRDYALRNAAWHSTKAFGSLKTEEEGRIEGVTDVFTLHSPGWHEPWPIDDTVASTRETKRVAKLFGAQLVGICDYDERWMFSAIYRRADVEHGDHPVEIPDARRCGGLRGTSPPGSRNKARLPRHHAPRPKPSAPGPASRLRHYPSRCCVT